MKNKIIFAFLSFFKQKKTFHSAAILYDSGISKIRVYSKSEPKVSGKSKV